MHEGQPDSSPASMHGEGPKTQAVYGGAFWYKYMYEALEVYHTVWYSLFSHPAPTQSSFPGHLHSLGDPLVFVSIPIPTFIHNVLFFPPALGFGWRNVCPDGNGTRPV